MKIIAITLLISTCCFAQNASVGYSLGSYGSVNGSLKAGNDAVIFASINADHGSVDLLYQATEYMSFGAGINGVKSSDITTISSTVWHPPIGHGKKASPGYLETVTSYIQGADKTQLGLRIPVMLKYDVPEYPITLFSLATPVIDFDKKETVVEASVGIMFRFGK